MNSRKLVAIGAAFGLAIAGTATGFAATASAATAQLPCDIINAAGQHCVAANSTTRALYASYAGPLYTVQRASDGQLAVVNTLYAGGPANSAQQDSFCAGTTCEITDIADQSPYNNDYAVETPYHGAVATDLPMTVDGQKVYGVNVTQGDVGYADYDTWMLPHGTQPITEYDVVTGVYNNQCCYSIGITEDGSRDDGAGHMFALNYSGNMAVDLENGVFGGAAFNKPLMTGFVKTNGTSSLVIEQGDATTGSLTASWNKGLPAGGDGTYTYKPLKIENPPGMILGTGGDGTSTGIGQFAEGVIVAGVTSAATDQAVQANVVAAGYTLLPPPGKVTVKHGKH